TIAVGNGDLLSIEPGDGMFLNSGDVSVDGGSTLRIVAAGTVPAIDNTGTITLASGSTLDLAGWFTGPSLGNLVNQGATTRISGTFDGEGGTVALGDTTPLGAVVLAGDIRNAMILANGALSIGPGDASLLNDLYAGPVELTADSVSLTIHEGVTVTDADGGSPGTIDVSG